MCLVVHLSNGGFAVAGDGASYLAVDSGARGRLRRPADPLPSENGPKPCLLFPLSRWSTGSYHVEKGLVVVPPVAFPPLPVPSMVMA